MSFSTFNISELPEESENDYAVEITTSDSKLGILLSETEARGIGQALLDAVDDGVDSLDGDHVDDYQQRPR